MKKIIYIVLTLIFLGAIYFLVDFSKAFELLKTANIFLIFLAVIVGVINSYLIAGRIQILFAKVKKLPVNYFWALSYLGSTISVIAPLSLGGFSMGYFLSKKAKVGYTTSLKVILLDFIIAFFPTIPTALISFWYFYDYKVFLIGAFILVFIIALFLKNIFILKAFLLSILIFVVSNLQFYLYLVAFNITPSFIEFILANSLLGILSLIPGAPGKLGQYETFGILTLPALLHIDSNAIFTSMVTMRIVSTLVILMGGYISLYTLKLTKKNITWPCK